jgi:hypothetical protein
VHESGLLREGERGGRLTDNGDGEVRDYMNYRMTVYLLVISLASISSCRVLAQDWTTKSYHSLVDGNDLYSACRSAQENIKFEGENMRLKTSEGSTVLSAGICWGYIEGVVDSIPGGEGFEPDASVRLSQYVDVVTAYLRDNPNQRHLHAYALVRIALTRAFPARRTKR